MTSKIKMNSFAIINKMVMLITKMMRVKTKNQSKIYYSLVFLARTIQLKSQRLSLVNLHLTPPILAIKTMIVKIVMSL